MTMLQALARDLATVMEEAIGPGEDVTLFPAGGGPPVPLRGIFDMPAEDVSAGNARQAIVSARPAIKVTAAAVQAALARPLNNRDHMLVRGVKYRVSAPRPDGMGAVSVKLLQGDDDA